MVKQLFSMCTNVTEEAKSEHFKFMNKINEKSCSRKNEWTKTLCTELDNIKLKVDDGVSDFGNLQFSCKIENHNTLLLYL